MQGIKHLGGLQKVCFVRQENKPTKTKNRNEGSNRQDITTHFGKMKSRCRLAELKELKIKCLQEV